MLEDGSTPPAQIDESDQSEAWWKEQANSPNNDGAVHESNSTWWDEAEKANPGATTEQLILAPVALEEVEDPKILKSLQRDLSEGKIESFQLFRQEDQDDPRWGEMQKRDETEGLKTRYKIVSPYIAKTVHLD